MVGLGKGRGRWERSKAVQSQKEAAPPVRGRWHAWVTAPPPRIPARCPPLPPSPVFWVCPLVSFLELWFSGSWQHPCFCFPLVGLRGLLGVGTSLGSFGGCLRGLPRPRFSVPSISCLEAKGWLDFDLYSLIFPSLGSRWKSDGWDARARPPACGARPSLPGASVLGAEDRPGSAAAAAGSKCGCLLGAVPAPEIAPARSPH